MKITLIFIITLFVSGCVIYLDYPEDQRVSGSVVLENGKPVAGAIVNIWEKRKYVSMVPISYPAAATTETNSLGKFEVKVKNVWPARITADTKCGRGESEVTNENLNAINIKVPSSC